MTHYGHSNIVRGTSLWQNKDKCRDFDTVEQHNETIINNINKVVQEDDHLYHLGDVSMGGKGNIYEFRKRVNCKNIHLILGNHDTHLRKNAILQVEDGVFMNAQNMFISCDELLEKKIGDDTVIMCHYPIYSFHKMHKGSIHLYGHTHQELNYNKQAICVSMECHPEFRPFHINEIRKIIENRKKDLDMWK